MTRLLALVLLLSGCADYPALDTRVSEAERTAPPPPLAPLTGLLAGADAVPATAPAGPDLAARAQALSSRADTLPAPGAGSDGDRLAGLAVRAEALRAGGLTQEERDRLAAGPSLP